MDIDKQSLRYWVSLQGRDRCIFCLSRLTKSIYCGVENTNHDIEVLKVSIICLLVVWCIGTETCWWKICCITHYNDGVIMWKIRLPPPSYHSVTFSLWPVALRTVNLLACNLVWHRLCQKSMLKWQSRYPHL